MTRNELAKKVAAQTGASTVDARSIIDAAFEAIKTTVANGEGVYLRGFGTFAKVHRAEKKARNISKGTTVIVPAHNVPHFKPSKAFKVK